MQNDAQIERPQSLLLTRRDAAKALAISERKLWELTATRAIPHVRIGRSVRYEPVALQEFIERHREGSAAECGPLPVMEALDLELGQLGE